MHMRDAIWKVLTVVRVINTSSGYQYTGCALQLTHEQLPWQCGSAGFESSQAFTTSWCDQLSLVQDSKSPFELLAWMRCGQGLDINAGSYMADKPHKTCLTDSESPSAAFQGRYSERGTKISALATTSNSLLKRCQPCQFTSLGTSHQILQDRIRIIVAAPSEGRRCEPGCLRHSK